MNVLVEDVMAILQAHKLVKSAQVVNYDETPSGRLETKIRCKLPENYQLQIWIHVEPESLDYAYQVFTNIPLLRWDNAPHYGHLPTAPHHFHDENGKVNISPLTGNIKKDLKIVLKEIDQWLDAQI